MNKGLKPPISYRLELENTMKKPIADKMKGLLHSLIISEYGYSTREDAVTMFHRASGIYAGPGFLAVSTTVFRAVPSISGAVPRPLAAAPAFTSPG